ncbi:MAG: tyrosine-type recombinase/integrase [Gemmatimonadales bacterium]|nr:tyrosine-type recombinase/integrase [Gemmatimonadales bacterium]
MGKPTRVQKRPFTVTQLDRLKAEDQPYEISEPSGLRLVVGRRSKSWVFRYRSPLSLKWRKYNIGRYPEVKLGDARTALTELQTAIENDIDPGDQKMEAKQEKKDAPTVDQVCRQYIEEVANKKKSGHEDKRYLESEVITRWGPRKVFTIKPKEIRAALKEVSERAPIASNRLLIYARLMFQFAVDQDYMEINPCAGIKPLNKQKSRQRVLSDSEIVAFWKNLEDIKCVNQVRWVLRLALVTAQRIGEVRQMRWSDLETNATENAWWTVPPEVAKNAKAHRVPLTPTALEIIDLARAKAKGSDFVFPGRDVDNAMGRNTPDQALRRQSDKLGIENFHIHDLRRTAGSVMTGMGIPRLTLAKVLNHGERGVTAVYDRYAYDKEKRKALEKWDRRLRAIMRGEPLDKLEKQLANLRKIAEADEGDGRPILVALRLSLEAGEMPPAWVLNKILPALENAENGEQGLFLVPNEE